MMVNECTEASHLLIQLLPCTESNRKVDTFPRGVFCCLVVELLQDDSKWKLVWSSTGDEVFDNLVTLSYKKTGHKITLIDRILFLEVQVRHKNISQFPVHCEVKQILEVALVKIGNKLNFYDWKINCGFLCSECQGGETHMTEPYTESSTSLSCYYGKTTTVTDSHRIWFEEVGRDCTVLCVHAKCILFRDCVCVLYY